MLQPDNQMAVLQHCNSIDEAVKWLDTRINKHINNVEYCVSIQHFQILKQDVGYVIVAVLNTVAKPL